jgi:peptidoglycan/xylan/chitin deacetylase (PgdA/CDA1 family)
VPGTPAPFSPNAILQVTPEFLEVAIERVRRLGLEIVTLDEAVTRIENSNPTPKFAVFTFDDGYRDNKVHALPVMRRLNCPFTLYIPTALIEGVGQVWWQALEDVIRLQKAIAIAGQGETQYLVTETRKQKQDVYDTLYASMRKMPEPERVTFIRDLCAQYGIDLDAHCRSLIMDWDELKTLAADPLCTIGAHSVHHYELSKLPEAEMRNEIAQSARVLEAQLGLRPQHFSYPIGSLIAAGQREYAAAKDLGFRSAVTTRPGGLFHHHAETLTALPRISLNGLYQEPRYMDVFATGGLFRNG